MPTYPVRRLTTSGPPVIEKSNAGYDPLSTGARMAELANAVYDVRCDELRLSSEEILEWLEGRNLRSTDLVMVDGTWTTIADSAPFSDAAEPYAIRERRVRNLRFASILFGSMAAGVALLVLKIWLLSPR